MTGLQDEEIDWQVAPAHYELTNYDEPKAEYKKKVENFIKPLSSKSLRKKTFFTIATNTLCADIPSSAISKEPRDRDLYLPIEIAITKWSLSSGKDQLDDLPLETKFFMINPGPPTKGSNIYSMNHRDRHKIHFDYDDHAQNVHIEQDLKKIVKDINGFLSPDRTVFSQSLRHVRQDLGCLKWLNCHTGYTMKPIKVLSLENLYVALIKQLKPDNEDIIGQGIALHRLEFSRFKDDLSRQCNYHKVQASMKDGESFYCARELSQTQTLTVMEDVINFGQVFENSQ